MGVASLLEVHLGLDVGSRFFEVLAAQLLLVVLTEEPGLVGRDIEQVVVVRK